MPVSELHHRVAGIALRAAARYGFALAGGNALLVHGLSDRFTQDVDLFTDEEGGVEAAAAVVEAALEAGGFRAERVDKTSGLGDVFEGMGEGLAEWIVTGPGGEQMSLQLAYFDRAHRPVRMDVGPVMDLRDVLGWKVCALASRVMARDYIDVAAALEHYRPVQLIRLAKRLDPGLTDRDFADAGRRVDEFNDREFAVYGLSRGDIARLRERFASWPRV